MANVKPDAPVTPKPKLLPENAEAFNTGPDAGVTVRLAVALFVVPATFVAVTK